MLTRTSYDQEPQFPLDRWQTRINVCTQYIPYGALDHPPDLVDLQK